MALDALGPREGAPGGSMQSVNRFWQLRGLRVGVGAVLLGLTVSGGVALAKNIGQAANPPVFPPDSRPYGKTYAEWSAELGKAIWENVYDPESCSFGHVGSVLLLSATTGGPGTFSCTVPSGTAFFCSIAMWLMAAPFDCSYVDPCDYEHLLSTAHEFVANPELLEADIDGVLIPNPERFKFDAPAYFGTAVEGNLIDYSFPGQGYVGPYGPATSSGWFMMVPPLPPGEHTIHFRAFLGDPVYFETETTHHITVSPDEGSGNKQADGTATVQVNWGFVKSLYR